MKLLLMTDPHLSASVPGGRKGDFIHHVDSKLQEIVTIAKDNSVTAVLCAGDVFHKPDPAYSAIGRFLTFLEHLNTRFITIAGSHDLFGNNYDSLYRTAIGMLDRIGKIELLCPTTKNITRVGDIVVGNELSSTRDIEIVHGSILPEPELVGEYKLISEYVTDARLVFIGHYHSGYDLTEVNGSNFLCLGSVVRTQAQPIEFTRRPRVAIVNDNLDVELIELESALPGEDVLEAPVVTPTLDFSSTIHEWRDAPIEDMSVSTLVKEVGKKEEASVYAIDYALTLLEKSE